MTLIEYFNKYPLTGHSLKFLAIEDGNVYVTLSPCDLGEPEVPFVLPNIKSVDCKFFNAGICKGSK